MKLPSQRLQENMWPLPCEGVEWIECTVVGYLYSVWQPISIEQMSAYVRNMSERVQCEMWWFMSVVVQRSCCRLLLCNMHSRETDVQLWHEMHWFNHTRQLSSHHYPHCRHWGHCHHHFHCPVIYSIPWEFVQEALDVVSQPSLKTLPGPFHLQVSYV